jgi:hypothetical protein
LLFRSALVLVIWAVAVLVSGAFITSTEVAARQPQSVVAPAVNDVLHSVLGIGLIAFTLAVAIGLTFTPVAGWLRTVAWIGVVTLSLDALLPKAGILHALLAHVFLSLAMAIAVGTSPAWNREPERVSAGSRPLLRPLGLAIPPFVFLQITLGAMYRHDLASVLPHLAFAMFVAFMALIGSSIVLQNFPHPKSLRRAAAALLAAILVQVCLGIGAFLMLLLNGAGTAYFLWVTVLHVLTGAATLAASVVMAMEVWRGILPRTAP